MHPDLTRLPTELLSLRLYSEDQSPQGVYTVSRWNSEIWPPFKMIVPNHHGFSVVTLLGEPKLPNDCAEIRSRYLTGL